jgi:hypothetical protein
MNLFRYSLYPSLIASLLITFFSCTKEIKIDYPNTEKQLVVEGYIEPGKYPIVFLTKSSPYFEKIDSANIAELIASVAKVTVSCNGVEEVLTLRYNADYFPPYYYEGTSIMGEIGKTYALKVELSGKTYTSSTKIVEPVLLEDYSFVQTTENISQKFINIKFTDPAKTSNFFRVYVKRIGKDSTFYPSYLSTFNDFGFDGKSFTYEVIRSYSPIIQSDNGRYFVNGDSVQLKFCSIEEKQYNYWKRIEGLIAMSANPFGLSSSEPPSTIEGGALGIWAGLSSSYYNFKIK